MCLPDAVTRIEERVAREVAARSSEILTNLIETSYRNHVKGKHRCWCECVYCDLLSRYTRIKINIKRGRTPSWAHGSLLSMKLTAEDVKAQMHNARDGLPVSEVFPRGPFTLSEAERTAMGLDYKIYKIAITALQRYTLE